MFKLSKKSAVETVLFKRFGHTNPQSIEILNEVNIWYSADNEINQMGICVELKLQDKSDENYQVNADGIVYSWGNAPIIDERSQQVELKLENVYKDIDEHDSDFDDDEE